MTAYNGFDVMNTTMVRNLNLGDRIKHKIDGGTKILIIFLQGFSQILSVVLNISRNDGCDIAKRHRRNRLENNILEEN